MNTAFIPEEPDVKVPDAIRLTMKQYSKHPELFLLVAGLIWHPSGIEILRNMIEDYLDYVANDNALEVDIEAAFGLPRKDALDLLDKIKGEDVDECTDTLWELEGKIYELETMFAEYFNKHDPENIFGHRLSAEQILKKSERVMAKPRELVKAHLGKHTRIY